MKRRRVMGIRIVLLTTAMAGLAARGLAQATPTWPDTYLARLEALALLQTINGKILASRSATLALEDWCGDHHLADDKMIVADVIRGLAKVAEPEQRRRLQVSPDTEVKYRKVRLRCGSRVVSEAENWYVPERLTAEMNRLLDTTNTPFGKVVRPLDPYRETIGVKMLWSPLPDGWERSPVPTAKAPDHTLMIPDALFEHRAIVYTGRHMPFSEVHEVYQKQLLTLAPPQ